MSQGCWFLLWQFSEFQNLNLFLDKFRQKNQICPFGLKVGISMLMILNLQETKLQTENTIWE